MPLPDPDSMVRERPKRGSVCCRTPDLKKWLDDLNEKRKVGLDIGSADEISSIARENGYQISYSTIRKHWRGECGGPAST